MQEVVRAGEAHDGCGACALRAGRARPASRPTWATAGAGPHKGGRGRVGWGHGCGPRRGKKGGRSGGLGPRERDGGWGFLFYYFPFISN
jgi:hypothetical protein